MQGTVLRAQSGFFWVQTVDYHGTALMVAATSVRQAYAVAHKRVWINPEHEHPVGIVSKYHRDTGYTLWCGCSGHSVTGGDVGHGAGIRALRAAIDAHHCDDPRAERVCTPARRAKVMNVPPLDASHAPTPERAQDQQAGPVQPLDEWPVDPERRNHGDLGVERRLRGVLKGQRFRDQLAEDHLTDRQHQQDDGGRRGLRRNVLHSRQLAENRPKSRASIRVI